MYALVSQRTVRGNFKDLQSKILGKQMQQFKKYTDFMILCLCMLAFVCVRVIKIVHSE
jgi:hypothetical protein